MTKARWREPAKRVTIVLAVGAGLLLANAARDGRGGGTATPSATGADPTAPEASGPDTTAPTASQPGTSAGSRSAYRLQPERRYLTIGTIGGQQFSDDEIRELATSYDVIVLAKFHGGWDIRLHHEAARRLKEANPDLEVYAYISTKYWFDRNQWDGAVIDPAWLLRDDDGELVRLTDANYDPESDELGTFVDAADPAYRAWLVDVAASWMAAAPYDGIRFDAADHIGDHGDREIRRWEGRLSPERIAAYNAGIDSLFREVGAAIAPRRLLFNGISPGPIRGPGRGLEMLAFTDGAMDEDFCLGPDGELHDIVEDIQIMEDHPDELLQFRARIPSIDLAPAHLARLQRVCVGSFLLGWQPGSTHLSLGTGYGVEQLGQQPPDLDVDLGPPTAAMTQEGGLLSRRFADGIVFVNLDDSAVEIELPEPLVLLRDGENLGTRAGPFRLDGEDAAFFLDPAVLG